jgi:hypothetical protein
MGNLSVVHLPHIGGAKSCFDVVPSQDPRKIEIYLSRPRYLSSSAQTPGILIFMYEELWVYSNKKECPSCEVDVFYRSTNLRKSPCIIGSFAHLPHLALIAPPSALPSQTPCLFGTSSKDLCANYIFSGMPQFQRATLYLPATRLRPIILPKFGVSTSPVPCISTRANTATDNKVSKTVL